MPFLQEVFSWEGENGNRPIPFHHFKNRYFAPQRESPLTCYLPECTDIEAHTDKMKKSLHPYQSRRKKCSMMIMINLAESDWVQVKCSEKLLKTTVCMREDTAIKTDTAALSLKQSQKGACATQAVLFNNSCFLFAWFNRPLKIFKNKHNCFLKSTDTDMFQVLYKAIDSIMPPLLYNFDGQYFQEFQYKRYLNKFVDKQATILAAETSGLFVSKQYLLIKTIALNMKQTHRGSYMSSLHLCDKWPNKTSGVLCDQNGTMTHRNVTNFLEVVVQKNHPVCSQLMTVDSKGHCKFLVEDVSPVIPVTSVPHQPLFTCPDTHKTVNAQRLDDLVADCGPVGNDEPILKALLANRTTFRCTEPFQVHCMKGHSRCFNVSEICSYQLDRSNLLQPCRGGNHLHDCETFSCNMKFKCPLSYCIPWHYVCNGLWDCPTALDETKEICDRQNRCNGMFKCRDTTFFCVAVGSVCDSVLDCPMTDDEEMCELKHVSCPLNCVCLALAISCTSKMADICQRTVTTKPFRSIFFSSQTCGVNFETFSHRFPMTVFLTLQKCNITTARHHLFTIKMQLVDVSQNKISEICDTAFPNENMKLKMLKLRKNNINYLNENCFASAVDLLSLDLSLNSLKDLADRALLGLVNLKFLFLENITFGSIGEYAFSNTTVKKVFASDYQICLLILPTECTAQIPWYVSTSRLFPDTDMQIVSPMFACLVTIMSCISILLHMKHHKLGITFVLTVIAIDVNDFLCVAYLSILWISDVTMAENFRFMQEAWKSGIVCLFAGSFLLNFTIFSQLVLSLFSLSRMMVVVHPMDTKFKQTNFVCKCLFTLAGISFCLTAAFIVSIRIFLGSFPTPLCSPFVDTIHQSIIIFILATSLFVSQTFTSVSMIVEHATLVKYYKNSQKHIHKSTKSSDTKYLVTQLTLLPLSCFCCWFPMNLFYVVAMATGKFPVNIFIWGTIAIFPLNSWFHPTIFVIWQVRSMRSVLKVPFHVRKEDVARV